MVVRRYIDFLILLITTPLLFFVAASLLFVHFKKFFVLVIYRFCDLCNNFFVQYIRRASHGSHMKGCT